MHFILSLQQERIAQDMPSKSDSKWPGRKKARKQQIIFALIWIVDCYIYIYIYTPWLHQASCPHLFYHIYSISFDVVSDTAKTINYSRVLKLIFRIILWLCTTDLYGNVTLMEGTYFEANRTPNGKTSLLLGRQVPHLRRSTLRRLWLIYRGQEHYRSLSKSIEFPLKS